MIKKIFKYFLVACLLIYILILLAFLVLAFVSKFRNDNSFFGYQFLIVGSDSMQPSISSGDLLIIKKAPYKVGDIVCCQVGSFKIAHRIIEINGNTITLKGDNLDTTETVNSSQIIGTVVKTIKNASLYINVIIFCGLVLIFAYLVYYFISHKRRKQQLAKTKYDKLINKLDYKKQKLKK